jgi:hypothetical protein
MTHIVLIAIAVAHHATMTTPLADSDRHVLLVDAYSFRLTWHTARANQTTCERHHEVMRAEIPDWLYEAWNDMMSVRRQRWAMLVDALDERLSADYRLRRLNELRDSLGTEAFFGGRMVGAVPDYGE